MAKRRTKATKRAFVSFPIRSTLTIVPHPNTHCTDRESNRPVEICQASYAHPAPPGEFCVARVTLRARRTQPVMPLVANDDLLPSKNVEMTPWSVEENVDVLGLGVGKHFFEIFLATHSRVFQAAKSRGEKVS